MSEQIEKYLKENNADSEFISDIVDQLWLMPSCDSDEETLDKLSTWVTRYRYENSCEENLDFPSLEDITDEA